MSFPAGAGKDTGDLEFFELLSMASSDFLLLFRSSATTATPLP